jgi:ribonuclease R
LAILWVSFKIMEEPTSENFAKLLEEVKWHEKQRFLEKAILVTMQRANYTKGREWHFWLSIDFYSHFTSPIRRYPDLQIHRIIKEIINWDWTEQREEHYNSILDNIAEQSSVEEDKSEAIEKKVNKLMAVKYMSDKIWETFEWFIGSINERWVFVELANTIEWMIDINKESGAQFNKLCEWLYEFTDEDNDIYNVWDNVIIELISVNEETLRINFDIKK